MSRSRGAATLSVILLSAAIVVWHDLFFFSKVIHLPAWTAHLPSPINTPAYMAFLCLAPAAFLPPSHGAAVRSLTSVLLSAPIPGLAVHAFRSTNSGADLWINVLFNYAWVIGFTCLVPALFLLALRVGWYAIRVRGTG